MALEPADVLTASGVDHLALLRSDSVLQAMRRWLSE
jgi:hypothetical protein